MIMRWEEEGRRHYLQFETMSDLRNSDSEEGGIDRGSLHQLASVESLARKSRAAPWPGRHSESRDTKVKLLPGLLYEHSLLSRTKAENRVFLQLQIA